MAARIRQAIAALLFAASILLNAHTLYRALRPHPIAPPPPFAPITDPAELAAAEHDLAGTYVTGERYGDRMIAIEAGGRIRFFELGAADASRGDLASYRLGRIGRNLALVTDELGVVEALSIDTLEHFGDRYTRTASPPSPSDPTAPPSAKRGAPRVVLQGDW